MDFILFGRVRIDYDCPPYLHGRRSTLSDSYTGKRVKIVSKLLVTIHLTSLQPLLILQDIWYPVENTLNAFDETKIFPKDFENQEFEEFTSVWVSNLLSNWNLHFLMIQIQL